MTPSARLALVLELLEEIQASSRPADLVAGAFLRQRRFIGAKDRRAISERLWGCLRRKARLAWTLASAGVETTPLFMVLADLIVTEGLSVEEVAALAAEPRGIGALDGEDRAMLGRLSGRKLFHHDMPAWVRGEYPEWLEPRLAARFADRLATEMGALRDEAPLDLRVNTLKGTRDEAMARLAALGLAPDPTPYSPLGLRLKTRTALAQQDAFKDGLVEVQDEGSQLIALLSGAKPGQAVVDFCAGAGGKTLTLAAMMENKGRLIACDTHSGRAEKAQPRLRRAGVHNVTRHVLEGGSDKWVKRQSGRFDVVLVDAPCSGTGTWRRNPDAKWRLSEQDLNELVALQARILDQACRLVRPGGRLVYATCSLLGEEGEAQARRLLDGGSFDLVPLAEAWAEGLGTPCPFEGPFMALSPATTGTDGFFAAILRRKA